MHENDGVACIFVSFRNDFNPTCETDWALNKNSANKPIGENIWKENELNEKKNVS